MTTERTSALTSSNLPLVVLVTGGRSFGVDNMREYATLWGELSKVHCEVGRIHLLVHGNCPTGADAIAEEWALQGGILSLPLSAPWDELEACGKRNAAGPLRNAMMVRAVAQMRARKLVVVAPGRAGTADCVRRVKAAGIEVRHLGACDA